MLAITNICSISFHLLYSSVSHSSQRDDHCLLLVSPSVANQLCLIWVLALTVLIIPSCHYTAIVTFCFEYVLRSFILSDTIVLTTRFGCVEEASLVHEQAWAIGHLSVLLCHLHSFDSFFVMIKWVSRIRNGFVAKRLMTVLSVFASRLPWSIFMIVFIYVTL